MNFTKNMQRIVVEFNKLSRFSKMLLRNGVVFCTIFIMIGATVIFLSDAGSRTRFTSIEMIKSGFKMLAEVIIGTILINSIIKK